MKHLLLKLIAWLHYPSRVRMHIADMRLAEARCEKARHLIKALMANPAAEKYRPQLRTMLLVVGANETVAISNRAMLETHLAMYQAMNVKTNLDDLHIDEVTASFDRAMQSLIAEGVK